MRKVVTVDYQEIVNYTQTIDQLRNQITVFRTQIKNLNDDVSFLKDSGENILVIVKNQDKPDVHEYKTTEKNVLTDLVQENYRVRERYDELSRKIDNVENQKNLLILKYKEMETIYKDQLKTLENYVEFLEERSLMSRIKNETKNLKNTNFISYEEQDLMIGSPTKTIYSEDEIKRLEQEASKVRKPRGWHFKEEYVDSEGNVYHKGKLQPHLKKSL